jgi:hypothetical protein
MDTEKRTSFGGLIGLLLIFTLFGFVLSWLYLGLVDVVPYIWPIILITAFFGMALAHAVRFLKKNFKITSAVGPLIMVIVGLLLINFMRWQMFFAIWYTRYTFDEFYWWFEIAYLRPLWQIPEFLDAVAWIFAFPFDPANNTTLLGEFVSDLIWFNEVGTWGLGQDVWTGTMLTLVWIAELLIICVPAIIAAVTPVGVFLHNKGTWADPVYLTYEFEEFTDEELDRLARGEIEIVINKPTVSMIHKGRVSKVAICYLGSEPTEYIAVVRAKAGKGTDDKGKLSGGHRLLRSIRLSHEKVAELQQKLSEKHGYIMPPETDVNLQE